MRVVGLEPEKLFSQLDKYRVQVNKMPKFSNIFDSYETFVPGQLSATSAAAAVSGSAVNQSSSV